MRSSNKHPLKAIALVSVISSYIVGGVVGGVMLGLWLDNWLGTRPFLLIVCLLLGISSGFFGVYQVVKPYLERKDE